jgi:hypothetical protein
MITTRPPTHSPAAPIIAVTPWRYVWRSYVHGTGDRWRCPCLPR